MSAQTAGPDFEGVLGRHPSFIYIAARKEGHILECAGWRCRARLIAHRYGDLHATHRAHVAAELRAEVGRWLGSEAERTGPGSVRWNIDHYGPLDAEPFRYSRYESPAHAALAALAECVGVDEVGA